MRTSRWIAGKRIGRAALSWSRPGRPDTGLLLRSLARPARHIRPGSESDGGRRNRARETSQASLLPHGQAQFIPQLADSGQAQTTAHSDFSAPSRKSRGVPARHSLLPRKKRNPTDQATRGQAQIAHHPDSRKPLIYIYLYQKRGSAQEKIPTKNPSHPHPGSPKRTRHTPASLSSAR